MEDAPNYTLRQPNRISNVKELENAKKKAHINAVQNRQRIKSSLNDLKSEGPSILLKTVVLPVVGVGVALYAGSKLLGALGSSKRKRLGSGQNSYDGSYPPASYSTTPQVQHVQPQTSLFKKAAVYAPIALKLTKMGVSYLEKNGTKVPQLVHDLLAGPGGSPQQRQ